ncbi:M48 family metallopeptidase [Methylocaldum sp.]|uniref:M48 family metallopeptidase n=1 Tax=Methylocaldum sp. TaxID=1969727 RepID=UPI002D2B055D|nr:M48 family metallopeptidase [Methylocaldum sp.]HYE36152.1 M48 family metallopeptidase [Methylocaldum sp.]
MKRILLVAFFALILSACATSPLGRTQFMMMPEDQVALMGSKAFVNMKQKLPIDQSPQTNQYVVCVAGPLIKEIGGEWEVAVFQDDSPNAFALPGGKIGVHTGILRVARNQDQLAAVVAHEVAHVLSRHSNERMSQQLAMQQGLNAVQAITNPTSQTGQVMMGVLGLGAEYGVLLPYSRLQESEADLLGLELMARAGFNPQESIDLWINMEQAGGGQPVEFLSTHPSHATRMQDLKQNMPKAMEIYRSAQAMGKNPRCGR